MSVIGKILGAIVQIAFIVVGFILGGPLGAFIGSIIGALASAGIQSLFNKRGTDTAQSSVNVRLAESPRWINAGRWKQGGAVAFADFAPNGDLWYIIIHSDSILTNQFKKYFDDIEITTDGSGAVLTKDFRLDDENNPVTSDGAGNTHAWVWTATYSAVDPVPPFPVAAFRTAFPSWTANHKLAGTTFSVIRLLGMKIDDRYKFFKWRGPLGLGEPSFSIVGDWSLPYDPRTGTYAFTRNAVLIWAWFRTHKYGRNKPFNSINWAKVAEQADICDQLVSGIAGTTVRYRCDCAIPDNQTRADAEQAIMITADMQLVFDDDGKCWPRVGAYYTPTLALSRNRDIVAMESVEAQNGESETQGVIIRYTEPDAKYTVQPAAAWKNPNYYVAGQGAVYLTLDAPFISDHNQAMRIAKGIGLRNQPVHKIAPTAGLRGLRAMQERVINLTYDNTFAGNYEVCTAVSLDASGALCSFGLVPIDPDRWTLLTGEEQPKPVVNGTGSATTPDLPVVTSLTFVNNRIEAKFSTPNRYDVYYKFQYIKTTALSSGLWSDMSVDMVKLFAFSGTVEPNMNYSIRFAAFLTSGISSGWSSVANLDIGQPQSAVQAAIYASSIVEVTNGLAIATIASDGTLTISNHTRRYNDGYPDKAVTGATISTGLAVGDTRFIAYDDLNRAGGAVTYQLFTTDALAHASAANPGRHFVGSFTVPASGTGTIGSPTNSASDAVIDWSAYPVLT